MGAKCCKPAGEYDPATMSGDLPKANMQLITDPLVKFEKRFPFHRTHIKPYVERLFSLEKAKIDYEEFKLLFNTTAWT